MPLESVTFFTDRDLGIKFPEIVAAAGLNVKRHRDLFPADCPDEIWPEAVGKNGWVAVSHDGLIRYKPNELAAVVRHQVRLLIVIGKAPFPQLAENFVATSTKIIEFVEQHSAPWIAKIYRPTAAELVNHPGAPGTISLWYPSQRA